MKILLAIYLLFVAFATFAQKPLKITTTTDEFTGAKSTSTDQIWFRDMASYEGGLWLSLHQYPEGLYLAVVVNDDHLSMIDPGQKMIIKMADGTMITLQATARMVADYVSSDKYRLIPVYGLPEDDLAKLSTVLIEKIRIETNDGNLDREPSPKKMPAICMDAFRQFKGYLSK